MVYFKNIGFMHGVLTNQVKVILQANDNSIFFLKKYIIYSTSHRMFL